MADFYRQQLETLPRAALESYQLERLNELLRALAGNRFYAERLARAGVGTQGLAELKELPVLPFTSKRDLVEEQIKQPPYGRLLTYPLRDYPYFHQTSGTTGRPLKWPDTESGWQWWAECWQYVFHGARVSAADVIFMAFSFGPYISHWAAMQGAHKLGALTISGAGLSSKQRLQAILDNDCTVLVCTPTYALRLAEVATEEGIDLRQSKVRVTIHAGEPGASLPNVKSAIETAWGARCYDHAGATEVGAWAYACSDDNSAIHLNEAEFIFEVIDPTSGAQVAPGNRGELVITNLGRPGTPVIRYRTGDLVEMTTDICVCGRSFARIKGGVLGRADDMLIVRGVNLYPSALDNLIRAHAEVVEYEVNISRVRGMDELLIKLETVAEIPFQIAADKLSKAFRETFNIAVKFEPAAPNSLPRYEFKAKRFKRVDSPLTPER